MDIVDSPRSRTALRMNSRMPFWQGIQNNFREFEQIIHPLIGRYVKAIHISSQTAIESEPSRLKYVCDICTATASFSMTLDWQDTRSSAFTCFTEGRYEPKIEEILIKALQRQTAGVFVDVGSNEGFHSLNCLATLSSISVVAFEPNPLVREKLEKNLLLNELADRIVVQPYGLGDKHGQLDFFVPRLTGSSGGSLRNLHPDEGSSDIIQVEIRCLDDFSLRPTALKIDVEGNEMKVLLGGRETIMKHKPIIVVELLRKWMAPFGDHPQDAAKFLLEMGYKMFSIRETSIQELSEIDVSTEETNFLFVPSEVLKPFFALLDSRSG